MIAYKLLASLIIAALLAGVGYGYGKLATTKKYEPQLATLRAALETVNQQGQAQIAKGKETLDATQKSNTASVAAIRARYERMLQYAKSNNNPGAITTGTCGTDGTGSEQRAIEFEQSCALDANKVTQWQDWARRNQIPVAE